MRREAARAKRTASPGAPAVARRPSVASTTPASTKAKVTAAKRAAAEIAAAAPAAAPTAAQVDATTQSATTPKPRGARIPDPQPKVAASDAKPRRAKAPPKSAVVPKRVKTPEPLEPNAAIPSAGYATNTNGHGNADPAGTIVQIADAGASLLRSVLKRLSALAAWLLLSDGVSRS